MKTFTCLLGLLMIALPLGAMQRKPAPITVTAVAPKANDTPVSRVIEYRSSDLVTINTKMQYATLIVFPEGEQVTEVACGDVTYWKFDAVKNIVHFKPAKEGARSNIHVLTKSGNTYTLLLAEGVTTEPFDLRVEIDVKDRSMRLKAGLDMPEVVVPRIDAKQEREIQLAKENAAAWKEKAEAAESESEKNRKLLVRYPQQLRFNYRFAADQSPFLIEAIFSDGKFTFIVAHPQSPAVVYELVNGEPQLVPVETEGDVFIIRKVISAGYISVGGRKSRFEKKEK